MSSSKQGRLGRFRAAVISFMTHLTHKDHQRVKHPLEDAAKTIKESSHVTRGFGTGPAWRTSSVDKGIEQVAAEGYKLDEGSQRG